MFNTTSKIGLGLLLGSILMIFLGVFSLSTVLNDFEQSSESVECDEGLWIDNWAEDRGCSSDGDWGLRSLCCGILLILIGIGVGIGGIIGLFGGAISSDKKVIIIQNEIPKK